MITYYNYIKQMSILSDSPESLVLIYSSITRRNYFNTRVIIAMSSAWNVQEHRHMVETFLVTHVPRIVEQKQKAKVN